MKGTTRTHLDPPHTRHLPRYSAAFKELQPLAGVRFRGPSTSSIGYFFWISQQDGCRKLDFSPLRYTYPCNLNCSSNPVALFMNSGIETSAHKIPPLPLASHEVLMTPWRWDTASREMYRKPTVEFVQGQESRSESTLLLSCAGNPSTLFPAARHLKLPNYKLNILLYIICINTKYETLTCNKSISGMYTEKLSPFLTLPRNMRCLSGCCLAQRLQVLRNIGACRKGWCWKSEGHGNSPERRTEIRNLFQQVVSY